MPRRNRPKTRNGAGGNEPASCRRRITWASAEHAPRGVPAIPCRTCGAFHPAKRGGKKGRRK